MINQGRECLDDYDIDKLDTMSAMCIVSHLLEFRHWTWYFFFLGTFLSDRNLLHRILEYLEW